MDFISHGLWGGVLFGRKNKKTFWLTFLIGIAPDAFSFGIYFLVSLLCLTQDGRFPVGSHDPTTFPTFVY